MEVIKLLNCKDKTHFLSKNFYLLKKLTHIYVCKTKQNKRNTRRNKI